MNKGGLDINTFNMNYSINYDIDLADSQNIRRRVNVDGTTLDSLLDNLYSYVMDAARDDNQNLADEEVANMYICITKH